MNVWIKSQKANKNKSRFTTSTVSAMSFASELQTIHQTEQNSSQDNQTLKSNASSFMLRGQPSFVKEKNNPQYSKHDISYFQTDSRIDQIGKKTQMKIGNGIRYKTNKPSSYNSESMGLWHDQDNFPIHEEEFNNESHFSTTTQATQGARQVFQKEPYYTSSTSNIIVKIQNNNENSQIQKDEDFSYDCQKRIQRSFVKKHGLGIGDNLTNYEYGLRQVQVIKRQNIYSIEDHKVKSKKIKEVKFFETQINRNQRNNSIHTMEEKKNVNMQVKMKKTNFLSSCNEFNNSSQSQQLQNSYVITSVKANHIGLNYSSTERSKINTLNSKSIRPTTGKKVEDLREYTICIMEYCSNQVGLACYNNNTGQIILSQIIENKTYFKTLSTIQRYYPLEIIYSQSIQKSFLIKKLMEKFKKTPFRPVSRKIFDQTRGFYLYNQRSIKEQYNPNNKFVAYACFNALVFYLQSLLETKFKYDILQIKWHRLQEVLVIETQTIADLQIFFNFQTKRVHNSFIQNFKCRTYGGTRMLRANILQPPSSEKIILQRQQLVQKLLENHNISSMLEKQLVKFKYYEPVTSKFIQSPRQQNEKSLKTFLSAILLLCHQCIELKNFKEKLQSQEAFKLPIISNLKQKLQSRKLSQLKVIIDQNFDEQVLKNYESVKNKKDKFIFLFKVQKIQDQYAQVTRITYSQTVNSIIQIFESIKAKSKEDLKLLHNDNRGYYISAKRNIDLEGLAEKIKQNIIHISERGKSITFSTSVLVSLNNRLQQSERVLIFQSESLLRKIIDEIQENIDILFEINHLISIIDMILSFVCFIQKNNDTRFIKPIFSKGHQTFKAVKINPIWMNLSSKNNQHQFSMQKFHDKSIFCFQKQQNSFSQQIKLFSVAYLVILGQIGCFVPAEEFVMDLFDTLVSKIQLHETIQMNMSRFQLTISHFRGIIQNCTIKSQRSLILIDQLVKGTQHTEQCALSFAIIEQLKKNKGLSFILCSDRMILNILQNFKSVSVEYTKNGENNHEREQEMNEWIINSCGECNFDKDFIKLMQQVQVKDNFNRFEEISETKKEQKSQPKTQNQMTFTSSSEDTSER